MKKPYKLASSIPFFRDPDFFVKKETVSGIMGKTQGVRSATSPPRKPIMKIPSKPLPAVDSAPVPPQLDAGLFISIDVRFNPVSFAVTSFKSVEACEKLPSLCTVNLNCTG